MKWGNGQPIRGKLIWKSHAYGIFFTEKTAAAGAAAKIEAKASVFAYFRTSLSAGAV